MYRYENIISANLQTGLNDYIVKVWFVSKNNDKLLYTFTIAHNAPNGFYKIENLPNHDPTETGISK